MKAVSEARQAARTGSGNLPPTPVLPGDQAPNAAGAAAAGSTQAPAPSASFGSGGQGGTTSGAAPSSGTVDAESNAKESKGAAGMVLHLYVPASMSAHLSVIDNPGTKHCAALRR